MVDSPEVLETIAKQAAKDADAMPPFVAERVHESVTVAANPDEDTRAIAGPEAPKPFESLRTVRKAGDAEALIEAARQYHGRTASIGSRVDDLADAAKALGIEINVPAVMLGIKLVPDERLETISLVLPVIDALEAKVARLTAQVADQREKVKQNDTLATENRRLRLRNEALISERITTAQRGDFGDKRPQA